MGTTTRELTPKQIAFIQAYRECGIASEAYRRSYNAEGMTPGSIRQKASEVLAHPRVKKRLDELEERALVHTTVTAELLIERNLARAVAADAAGQHSAAVAAEQLAAKLAGLLVDKVDQTVRQAATEEMKPDLSNLRQKAARTEQPVTQDAAIPPPVADGARVTH
jgi:phage terminase small subunit